ncbi:carbohydrate-binding protein, partial [Pseudoalteromonas ruthenica]
MTLKFTKGLHSAVLGLCALPFYSQAYDCQGIDAWSSVNTYVTGNLVTQNNTAYQAKWWTQAQSPADNSTPYAVWDDLGTCGGNQAPTIN